METKSRFLDFIQYAIAIDPKTSRKTKTFDLDVKCEIIASVDLGKLVNYVMVA